MTDAGPVYPSDIQNNGDYSPNHFDLLLYITVGVAVFWVFFGTILGFYVRSQTKDPSTKSSNCVMAFWLTGLALSLMWTLWFCMFSAQNYPQLRPIANSQCALTEFCAGG
mmetsp:Transcript_29945/g.45800  ORF Transcript_29945/g.45800 Transcript_29945/m.45800 type:complete len:110 (-) Transcript_29945:38-367(-)